MFNLRKKRTASSTFFKSLSSDQKKGAVLALGLIAACDADRTVNDKALHSAYSLNYMNRLSIKEADIPADIPRDIMIKYLQSLSKCTDYQKAILIFIFRGMSNIANPASERQQLLIQTFSKEMNFNLKPYLADKKNSEAINNYGRLFSEIIFENNKSDIIDGANLTKNLALNALTPLLSELYYGALAVVFETMEIRTPPNFAEEVKALNIEMTHQNINTLFEHLNNRLTNRILSPFYVK